ncbi:hypothetical protein JCM10213_000318 [Rhodosporidiobolus nylandii]
MLRKAIQRLTKPLARRNYAQQVDLPPHLFPSTSPASNGEMASNASDGGEEGLPIYRRVNVFGSPLLPAPVAPPNIQSTTGFFRNNLCDASPHDPGSHTVAAVVTPEFLDFSKSQGNDLWSLFPSLRQSRSASSSTPAPPCVWCLCASRWLEAFRASASHPLGDKIVPRVVLEATHERALKEKGGPIEREIIEGWATGGDGTGQLGGGGGGEAAQGGRERVGR